MSWNAKKPDCDPVHEDRRLRAISTVQDSLVTKDEVDTAIPSGSSSGNFGGSLKNAIDWSQGTWNSITEVEGGLILKVAYNLRTYVSKYDMIDSYGNVLSTHANYYNSTDFHIKQYLFCPRLTNGNKTPFYNVYNTVYCPQLLANPYWDQYTLQLVPTFQAGTLTIANSSLLTKTFLRRAEYSSATPLASGKAQNYTLDLNFNFLKGYFQSARPMWESQNGYVAGQITGDGYPGHWVFDINLTTNAATFTTTGVSYSSSGDGSVASPIFDFSDVSTSYDTQFSSIQICPQYSAYGNKSTTAPDQQDTYYFSGTYYTHRNQVAKDPYYQLSGNGFVPYSGAYKSLMGVDDRLNGNSDCNLDVNDPAKTDFEDSFKNLTHDFVLNNITTIV